jgi:hypothetical protein
LDCPLREEAVRDSREHTLIKRICHDGANRQVCGTNTTEHVVEANAETDRMLCSPQDPVTGGYTPGVKVSTYGLLGCINTRGNRHGVVVQETWIGG